MQVQESVLDELRSLQTRAAAIRKEHGISEPEEIIWQADDCDSLIQVVADGLGAARVQEVEGNFPVDYITKRSEDCASEDAAVQVARQWLGEEEEEIEEFLEERHQEQAE